MISSSFQSNCFNIWIKLTLNTFVSQPFVFEEKNEPFVLENASNLTHEFLYNNFNKNILLNILVKIVIKNLMHFQGEIIPFFLKNEALRSKSVKTTYRKNLYTVYCMYDTKEQLNESQVWHRINTLMLFWLILGKKKTSLVIFLWKKERVQLSFLATILFLMALYGHQK